MNYRPTDVSRRNFVQSAAAFGAAFVAPSLIPGQLSAVANALQNANVMPSATLAEQQDFWREVRAAFTVSPTIINLDNGNVSPSPRIVSEAVARTLWSEQESPVVYREVMMPTAANMLKDLARLLGCSMEEVAVTRNATEALHNILLGVELPAGAEVLTTTHDYWSMQNALDQRAAREGIVIRRVAIPASAQSMDELFALIERGITPKTKLILISNPVNLTGHFFPVRRICDLAHARGIDVCVDGAQGFAHVDFKITDLGCDYYATSLHKWLMAPIGTGLLYVRKDKIPQVWPLMPSFPEDKNSINKFMDVGTRSAAQILPISDAIRFHEMLGAKRKEERLRFLTRYWVERVRSLPKVRFLTNVASQDMSCGLTTFAVEGVEPRVIEQRMQAKGILVQAMRSKWAPDLHGVRITPNVYTTTEELDAFCDVVRDVAR